MLSPPPWMTWCVLFLPVVRARFSGSRTSPKVPPKAHTPLHLSRPSAKSLVSQPPCSLVWGTKYRFHYDRVPVVISILCERIIWGLTTQLMIREFGESSLKTSHGNLCKPYFFVQFEVPSLALSTPTLGTPADESPVRVQGLAVVKKVHKEFFLVNNWGS